MAKKSLLFLCALLAALTLQADLTLNNVALPQPLCLIQGNQKAAKGTLAEALQSEELNDADEAAQFANLIPAEIKDNLQVAAVLSTDFTALAIDPSAAKDMQFVAGIHCSAVSMKSFFDMLQMAPMMKPELAQNLTIEPCQIQGYNGYKVKGSLEDMPTLDLEMVISQDGKTILIGSKGLLAKAIAAPAPMPAILQSARRDFAGDIFAITVVIPTDLQAQLDELVGDSSFDADTKSALKAIPGLALRFQGKADSLDLSLQTDLPTADQAILLKNNVLDTLVVPTARQMLPAFLPGASVPQTIAATQNDTTLALSLSLTRQDLEMLKELSKDVPGMLPGMETLGE